MKLLEFALWTSKGNFFVEFWLEKVTNCNWHKMSPVEQKVEYISCILSIHGKTTSVQSEVKIATDLGIIIFLNRQFVEHSQQLWSTLK